MGEGFWITLFCSRTRRRIHPRNAWPQTSVRRVGTPLPFGGPEGRGGAGRRRRGGGRQGPPLTPPPTHPPIVWGVGGEWGAAGGAAAAAAAAGGRAGPRVSPSPSCLREREVRQSAAGIANNPGLRRRKPETCSPCGPCRPCSPCGPGDPGGKINQGMLPIGGVLVPMN
eukprot:gene10414-biopygen9339